MTADRKDVLTKEEQAEKVKLEPKEQEKIVGGGSNDSKGKDGDIVLPEL